MIQFGKALKLLVPFTFTAVCLFGADGHRSIAIASEDTVFSHIAAGGGWSTTIKLMNLYSLPAAYQLRFYQDDGTPWNAPFVDGTKSVVSGTIPVNGSVTIQTLNPAAVSTGWAELSYDWSVAVVGGLATFRYNTSAVNRSRESDWEATVPVSSNTSDHFALSFDQTVIADLRSDVAGQPLSFGMAVVNPASLPADITVVAWDENGNRLFSQDQVIQLAPKAHTSFLLGEKWPALAGKKGVLEFKVNSGKCAVLGLRANPTGAVSSVHTIDFY